MREARAPVGHNNEKWNLGVRQQWHVSYPYGIVVTPSGSPGPQVDFMVNRRGAGFWGTTALAAVLSRTVTVAIVCVASSSTREEHVSHLF
jgi:hypothetical protein